MIKQHQQSPIWWVPLLQMHRKLDHPTHSHNSPSPAMRVRRRNRWCLPPGNLMHRLHAAVDVKSLSGHQCCAVITVGYVDRFFATIAPSTWDGQWRRPVRTKAVVYCKLQCHTHFLPFLAASFSKTNLAHLPMNLAMQCSWSIGRGRFSHHNLASEAGNDVAALVRLGSQGVPR